MDLNDRILRRHRANLIAAGVLILIVLLIASVYWLFTGEWILK